MSKSKTLTLKICPTAICVKSDCGMWEVWEDKDADHYVSEGKTPAQAWEEAYLSLDKNWIKIPGDWVHIKPDGNGWRIDAFNDYWTWARVDEKVGLKHATYGFTVEQYTGATYKNRWFWSAYADESNPLYYKLTTNKCHMLKSDCRAEMESVIKFFGLNAYEEIVHVEKKPIK